MTTKCGKCGSEMKHYDWVKRLVRRKGGEKEFIKIERMRCKNCGHVKRILPEDVKKFKQYEADIINGVKAGYITPDTFGFEDYPCEMTMERWKK